MSSTEAAPSADDMRDGESRDLLVAGQALRVFTEAPPLLADVLCDVERARRRIWVEVYILADDDVGRALVAALAAKAAHGLDVRLMYDAVGSQATPSALLAPLYESGVKVHAYHTWTYALRRFRFFEIMNQRNHRKVMVIDDDVAYFGGMNFTDPMTPAPAETPLRKPSDTRWRDVHVRLAGPQALEIAESFDRVWRKAHHERVARRPRAYRRGRLPGGASDYIRFFDSGPGLRNSRATRVFRRLFNRSRQSIWLCVAYFIPTPTLLRALWRARRRGVQVRLIVPGLNDVPIVRRALRYLYGRLIRVGIAVYERQHRMVHSKVAVIDDTWSVVGSCNLDPRSLEYNLEFLAVIRSPAFAALLVAICQEERRESRRITFREVNGRTWWQRASDWVAYSLRWFL